MFSIITVNYNGEKYLDQFLKSLKEQIFTKFKLYLVDNGSIDNSLNILNKYKNKLKIHLIKLNKNYGFAQATNIGIREAMMDSNPYILTLNNDIELMNNCLINLYHKINTHKASYDIFQLMMINYYNRNIIDAAGINFDKYYYASQIGYKKDINTLKDIPTEIQGACAGAAVYSKKCLVDVKDDNNNFFDSTYFAYYEDVDLAYRLLNSGYKTLLVKDAVVFHVHSGTGGLKSTFKVFYYNRNLFYFFKKNLPNNVFRRFKFKYIKDYYLRLFKYVITFNFKLALSSIKGYRNYKVIKKNLKNKIQFKDKME